MSHQTLVSIIIPTFNRAHLIGETLNSILAQTYIYWECYVIDDGSSDNTEEIVENYIEKDSRFSYHKRSEKYLPGGNGARNYGLDIAKGDFVVFFDSDDLMTGNHLQVKLDLISSGDFDFGVTRTKYFNYTNELIDRYYSFSTKDITKENYILQNINWLTLDSIIKSSLAKTIRFNEIIKSGQEYNFFSKLVCKSEKGVFLDEVVSLRRHHNDSKRTTVAAGEKANESVAITTWFTYLETKSQLQDSISKLLLFRTYCAIVKFKKFPEDINKFKFWEEMFKRFKSESFIKYFYCIINRYTNRLHFIRKKALHI